MSTPVSPKVVAATAAAIVVPALLAVGTYVLANQDVLGINNPVLGVFVVALITGAVTFLSGWLKRDPLRDVGAAAVITPGTFGVHVENGVIFNGKGEKIGEVEPNELADQPVVDGGDRIQD